MLDLHTRIKPLVGPHTEQPKHSIGPHSRIPTHRKDRSKDQLSRPSWEYRYVELPPRNKRSSDREISSIAVISPSGNKLQLGDSQQAYLAGREAGRMENGKWLVSFATKVQNCSEFAIFPTKYFFDTMDTEQVSEPTSPKIGLNCHSAHVNSPSKPISSTLHI